MSGQTVETAVYYIICRPAKKSTNTKVGHAVDQSIVGQDTVDQDTAVRTE